MFFQSCRIIPACWCSIAKYSKGWNDQRMENCDVRVENGDLSSPAPNHALWHSIHKFHDDPLRMVTVRGCRICKTHLPQHGPHNGDAPLRKNWPWAYPWCWKYGISRAWYAVLPDSLWWRNLPQTNHNYKTMKDKEALSTRFNTFQPSFHPFNASRRCDPVPASCWIKVLSISKTTRPRWHRRDGYGKASKSGDFWYQLQ